MIDEGVFFEGNCKMGTSNAKSDSEHPTTTSSASSSNNPNWQRKDEKRPEPVAAR